MKDPKNIALLVLAAVVVVLLWFGCNQRKKRVEQNAMYEAAADSLHYSNDSLTASIQVIEASREKDFLNMQTKDETIRNLQRVVKDYKGKLASATIATTTTTESGATKAIFLKPDTVIENDTVKIYPVYFTDWRDQWSIGSITASHDSIVRDIKIKNQFEFTHGYGRWNPFKKRELTVTMVNKNPNTITSELRTYTLKQSEKRFGVSVNVGYGVMLSPDGSMHHGLTASVGGSWRIFP